jgi:hypothetical protein
MDDHQRDCLSACFIQYVLKMTTDFACHRIKAVRGAKEEARNA